MNAIQPHLVVDDGRAALDFYQAAFGAEITLLLEGPGPLVGHAELALPGGGSFALASEFPDMGILGPKSRGGTSVSLHLDVPDCDAAAERAVKAGATQERAPTDEFYGHRTAVLVDPFGHRWMVSHEMEKLSQEEMQARYEKLLAEG